VFGEPESANDGPIAAFLGYGSGIEGGAENTIAAELLLMEYLDDTIELSFGHLAPTEVESYARLAEQALTAGRKAAQLYDNVRPVCVFSDGS